MVAGTCTEFTSYFNTPIIYVIFPSYCLNADKPCRLKRKIILRFLIFFFFSFLCDSTSATPNSCSMLSTTVFQNDHEPYSYYCVQRFAALSRRRRRCMFNAKLRTVTVITNRFVQVFVLIFYIVQN